MFKKFSIIGAAVASLGVLSAVAADKTAAPMQLPPPVIKTAETTSSYGNAIRNYVGLVKPQKRIRLQPRVSGFIKDYKFAEGAYVKKGDLLVDIEDTTYRAKVETAKANLKKSEAALVLAKSTFERNKRLMESHSISEQTYDESKCKLMTTEAEVDYARATLMDAENELSYTKVYAPLDGLMGITSYSSLNYVTPSSLPIVTLSVVENAKVTFTISDRDLFEFGGREKIAKNVTFTVLHPDGTPNTEKLTLITVDSEADQATGTVAIIAMYENHSRLFIPGSYLTVQLVPKSVEALPAVPITSILTDAKGSFVYVVEEREGKMIAERRNVQTGDVDGVKQIIKSGVAVGEKVVTTGTHKIIPGTPVIVSK